MPPYRPRSSTAFHPSQTAATPVVTLAAMFAMAHGPSCRRRRYTVSKPEAEKVVKPPQNPVMRKSRAAGLSPCRCSATPDRYLPGCSRSGSPRRCSAEIASLPRGEGPVLPACSGQEAPDCDSQGSLHSVSHSSEACRRMTMADVIGHVSARPLLPDDRGSPVTFASRPRCPLATGREVSPSCKASTPRDCGASRSAGDHARPQSGVRRQV